MATSILHTMRKPRQPGKVAGLEAGETVVEEEVGKRSVVEHKDGAVGSACVEGVRAGELLIADSKEPGQVSRPPRLYARLEREGYMGV